MSFWESYRLFGAALLLSSLCGLLSFAYFRFVDKTISSIQILRLQYVLLCLPCLVFIFPLIPTDILQENLNKPFVRMQEFLPPIQSFERSVKVLPRTSLEWTQEEAGFREVMFFCIFMSLFFFLSRFLRTYWLVRRGLILRRIGRTSIGFHESFSSPFVFCFLG
ncbi:MAG: hypothetical protein AAF203_01935, partial [Pseudomonadota bacterium]